MRLISSREHAARVLQVMREAMKDVPKEQRSSVLVYIHGSIHQAYRKIEAKPMMDID